MANYRRKTPRHGATARENSSDWRYPEVERGSGERSRVSTKRRANNFSYQMKEYLDAVGCKIPYRC